MSDVKFHTDKELCERWHCSTMKLWRMRQKGILRKTTKIGGGRSAKNLTPHSEVMRLEEGDREATP